MFGAADSLVAGLNANSGFLDTRGGVRQRMTDHQSAEIIAYILMQC